MRTDVRRTVRIAAGALAALLIPALAREASGQFLSPRFRDPMTYEVEAGASPGRQALAIGEVTGDLLPDLVVINVAGGVDVFHNQGDGTLALAATLQMGGTPTAVVLADVSAPDIGAPDGVLDVLIGNDAGEVVVRPGNGDGTFGGTEQSVDDQDLGPVVGMATGEFDGRDGGDVAVIDDAALSLLCNLDGALRPCGGSETLDIGVEDLIEILSGDFDGDGLADLVVLSREAQRVVPIYGGTAGAFVVGNGVSVEVEAPDGKAVDMAVVRLDGDANDDLVVVNDADNFQLLGATLFGRADRRFRVQAFVADFDAAALVVDAFDDVVDGGLDAIVGYSDGGASVNVGNGLGGFLDPFTPIGTSRVGQLGVLASTDLNGDERPDLVALNANGMSLTTLLNDSGPVCPGDCNVDGQVTVDEIVRGVTIALGGADPRDCQALERNGRDGVTIDELVAAVQALLNGCVV